MSKTLCGSTVWPWPRSYPPFCVHIHSSNSCLAQLSSEVFWRGVSLRLVKVVLLSSQRNVPKASFHGFSISPTLDGPSATAGKIPTQRIASCPYARFFLPALPDRMVSGGKEAVETFALWSCVGPSPRPHHSPFANGRALVQLGCRLHTVLKLDRVHDGVARRPTCPICGGYITWRVWIGTEPFERSPVHVLASRVASSQRQP